MQVANGDKAYVDHFVRPVLQIEELRAILVLNVFDNPIPMILGYPFLRIYWNTIIQGQNPKNQGIEDRNQARHKVARSIMGVDFPFAPFSSIA